MTCFCGKKYKTHKKMFQNDDHIDVKKTELQFQLTTL